MFTHPAGQAARRAPMTVQRVSFLDFPWAAPSAPVSVTISVIVSIIINIIISIFIIINIIIIINSIIIIIVIIIPSWTSRGLRPQRPGDRSMCIFTYLSLYMCIISIYIYIYL